MVLFFIVMVACFMTLSCTYYMHVQGDPSLDGAFDEVSNEGAIDAYLWPIIVTLLLLVFYYA